MKISAVAASAGESKMLKDCLESVKNLASEIIVFNMDKSDSRLYKIAKKYNAKVIGVKKVSYIELIRNKMIKDSSGDWILMLDPDERITPSLAKKLKEIATKDDVAAVNIPRKNIIFGAWVKHTNWWPDRQVRFFKKDSVRWSSKIHSYPKVNGNTHDLPAKEDFALVHYTYSSVSQFFERQNRYSSQEADNLIEKNVKPTISNLVWWPTREFLARYIKHLGFLDGWRGFVLVYLLMIYKVSVWIKLWERQEK